MKSIPYGNHYIDKEDISSVVKSLNKSILTRGPLVDKFEQEIAKVVNCKYAVAVSSCTAGLHIALKALKNDKRKQVLTSPISFVSTANTILLNDLRPEFVDIDKDSLNIDLEYLKKNFKNTKNIKAIMPVHLTGLASNSLEIFKFAKKNKINVIEDAAHSFGAKYECGAMVGSCKYSDMTVFSFHPVKSITTLEGGVITTNSKKIYEKLKILRSHGVVKKSSDPSWFYDVKDLGLNYRMSDVQSALGISQLKKLKFFMNKRKEISNLYDSKLNHIHNITIPCFGKRLDSANHLYVIEVDFKKIKIRRTDFMNKLNDNGFFTQLHYVPIPLHTIYKKKGYNLDKLPNTRRYYERAISLPIFVKLSSKDQNKFINILKKTITIKS